jgi:hypothetical protein
LWYFPEHLEAESSRDLGIVCCVLGSVLVLI